MRITDRLPYAIRLRLLHSRRRRVDAANEVKIKHARSTGNDENLARAQSDARFDYEDFSGSILLLQTQHLVDQLDRYSLPFPESSDWAEPEAPFYLRHLKREALARARAALRAEKKELWSARLLWLPLLTALTGFMGTLIGVIAVLSK
jgi:hypothetical protein